MKRALLIIAVFIGFCSISHAEFPAVEVYEKASKSVVLIIAGNSGGRSNVGAGSVIRSSGYIITNAHVVVNRSNSTPLSKIRIYLKPDRVTGKFKKDLIHKRKARVLKFDTALDIAILKVNDLPADTEIIELADPEDIKIGEEVVTIGHPEQGGLWTLTYGRISGEISNQHNINGKNVYQTDASVNRGNSGGPLLDRRGYMVGINTNVARLGAGNMPITGVNFAVKSAVIKKWLEKQDMSISYGTQPLRQKTAASEEQGKIKSDMSDNKKREPETPELHEKKKADGADKSIIIPEDKMLTRKRPYTFDALFEEVENEMEDIMEEMKGKIRKKR